MTYPDLYLTYTRSTSPKPRSTYTCVPQTWSGSQVEVEDGGIGAQGRGKVAQV